MLEQRDRIAALARLRELEHELAQLSAWLDQHDHERAAILAEDAYRDVLAVQALIDRDPAQVKRIVPDGRALRVAGT